MGMYNKQGASSAAWGDNVITITVQQTGEVITLSQCAFKKAPNLEYTATAKSVSWLFDCGKTSRTLGTY
jgi:hypothetical protein